MKRIIAILLLLALGWGAQAQFAGPDKHVARNVDNSQTVTLGVADASTDACYIWTGSHIEGNPNQAVITANPRSEAERYQVKRISKNGVEEDEVWVFVEDSIEIRYAKPKYGCYSDGDEITTDQFEIETYPTGYEHLVTVSPAVAQKSSGSSSGRMEVTFFLRHNNHNSTKREYITVINNDLDETSGASVNVMKLKAALENGDELAKKLEDFQEAAAGLKTLESIAPCSWNFDLNRGSGNFRIRKKCCSDHTPYDILLVTFPSASVSASYQCRFPFYGVPHVASLDVLLNLGLTLAVGPAQGELSFHTQCCTFCIPASLSFAVSGGVGASIGGDLIQADLLLQGSATASCTWCPVGDSGINCQLTGTVSIIGQLQLVSIVNFSVEQPLFTYKF